MNDFPLLLADLYHTRNELNGALSDRQQVETRCASSCLRFRIWVCQLYVLDSTLSVLGLWMVRHVQP